MKLDHEQIQASVDRRLSGLTFTDAMADDLLAQCRPQQRTARIRPRIWATARRVVAAAAVLAVVFTSGAVTVAANPPLRDSLSQLGDDILAALQPINRVSESDGIRMEVLAAMNDENVAVIYLSLQDTAGRHRLDDTTELADFQLRAPSSAEDGPGLFSHAETLWYDEETQTATLRLTSQSAQAISGKKLSLSIRSFLSGCSSRQIDTGYTLMDVQRANPLPLLQYVDRVPGYMASGAKLEELGALANSGQMPSILPFATPLRWEEQPWLEVSGAAIVNNMLHVRLNYDDDMGRFNRCSVLLTDLSGSAYDVSRLEMDLEQKEIYPFRDYAPQQEQVLMLPGEAFWDKVMLSANVTTYDRYATGKWQTTFVLESADANTLHAECDIDMKPWKITEVALSPIGVTAYGSGEMYAYSESASIQVLLNDGSAVDCRSSSCSTDGENIQLKTIFDLPVDLEQVEKVLLNGVEIRFGA